MRIHIIARQKADRSWEAVYCGDSGEEATAAFAKAQELKSAHQVCWYQNPQPIKRREPVKQAEEAKALAARLAAAAEPEQEQEPAAEKKAAPAKATTGKGK